MYIYIRHQSLMSEKAMLSHEAGRHWILNFTIKYGKYSVMVIGRGLFLSSYEAGR